MTDYEGVPPPPADGLGPEAVPEPPRETQPRVPRLLIVLLVVLVIAVIIVAVNALRTDPFEDAIEACDAPILGAVVTDGGDSLLLDHQGEEDPWGLDVTELACILGELDVPHSVIANMDSTRALDGRQSAEWSGFRASWSYHPNTGIDVIVERD